MLPNLQTGTKATEPAKKRQRRTAFVLVCVPARRNQPSASTTASPIPSVPTLVVPVL